MSISSASILLGGTVAASGGTATTFISKGDDPLSHKVILDDGSSFALQTEVRFSTKEPKVSVDAPNGYTQGRNFVVIQVPKLLANGNYTVNTYKCEISEDIEVSDAERAEAISLLAQMLVDTDYSDFWDKRSVA